MAEKLQVRFDLDGRPIGHNSVKFVSFVGRKTRLHCPPIYDDWSSVPDSLNTLVWDTALETYDLEPERKACVLQKANISWKNWKYRVRLVYDKFTTDAERRLHKPGGVKLEEWEYIILLCSTEDEQLKREKGKETRSHMKLPHTSGRRGAARTKEELEKQSANGKVTRTQLFVAIHSRKDGSCPFPEANLKLDQIKHHLSEDPSLEDEDLDHDPVALVCNRDGNGCVRGYGSGVSKTMIHASTPYKKIVELEKRKREDTDANVRVLMQRLDDETKARKILEEKIASAGIGNTHQGQCSSAPYEEANVASSSTRCLLKNFRRITIALGNVRRDITSSGLL